MHNWQAGKRRQAAAESLIRIRIQDIDLSLIVDSRQQNAVRTYTNAIILCGPVYQEYFGYAIVKLKCIYEGVINVLPLFFKVNQLLYLEKPRYGKIFLKTLMGNYRTCTKFQPHI